MNEYLSALQKYAVFTGRATRKEFWTFCLVHTVITVALLMLGGRMLSNLYGVLVILPIVGLSIRRLHDTDRSGWWLLVALVPVLGTILLLAFYIQPSSSKSRYA